MLRKEVVGKEDRRGIAGEEKAMAEILKKTVQGGREEVLGWWR